MPGQRPPKPAFRQLMLALPDMPDQIVPLGWRGWRATITSTSKAPPKADIGEGKPKPRTPRRKKPAT